MNKQVKTIKNPKPVVTKKSASMKHKETMKRLENKGTSGYNARKMEKIRENGKTMRTAARASAVAESAKAYAQSRNNQQEAIKAWNDLINGSEKPGSDQTSDTGDTTADNGGYHYV